MRGFTFLGLLVLLLAPIMSYASNVPIVHSYQLNNGLKLIVKEDHRAPVVFSSVWYKVGSTYEQNGTTGISHALEHMMFRGTKKVAAGQLARTVNENGGLQNAMTTNDYTMYYQFLPANRLTISFQLEADRMQNLLLSKEDFLKEIQVVMEERRMNYEDNPQSMGWVLLNAVAATNNPDHHPTIGWKGDLLQMTVDDLRQWYHHWYGPNNAVLVVVGDVQPDAVYSLAKKYFGAVPPVVLPETKKFIPEPYISTRKISIKLPAKIPLLMMAYNVPSIVTAKSAWQPYALSLLANILGNGDSSRLAQDLIRKQQTAVQVGVDYEPFRLVDNLLTIMVIPSPGHNFGQLQAIVLNEIEQLKQNAITSQELNRAKAQFIAEQIYENDSLTSQASQIGVAEMIGMPWQQALNVVQNIQAVTPEQIQGVAKTFLKANRLTIENLIPESGFTNKPQLIGVPNEHAIH